MPANHTKRYPRQDRSQLRPDRACRESAAAVLQGQIEVTGRTGTGLETVTDLGRIIAGQCSNNGGLARACLAKQPDYGCVAAGGLANCVSIGALLPEQLCRDLVPKPLEHMPNFPRMVAGTGL